MTARLESKRLELQATLDGQKTQAERNKLGQFATPPVLAAEVIAAAVSYLDDRQEIQFLDPAFGTGSFYSALLQAELPVQCAAGFEIDPHYGDHALELWSETNLRLCLADFTEQQPPPGDKERFNLLICNPPYVRHHHLAKELKERLQSKVFDQAGLEISGLSGLYCHFLLLSLAWMSKDGVAAWLIPSEFMDVNYGASVKQFLRQSVDLLRIHRFDSTDVQFGDALVSSAVVIFRNREPSPDHTVDFTLGGSLSSPRMSAAIPVSELAQVSKWTSLPEKLSARQVNKSGLLLADLFRIKRGLATGCNEFFILSAEEAKAQSLPTEFLRPILPSPRYLESDEIEANDAGEPLIERVRFLLDCKLRFDEIGERYPALARYLEQGKHRGIAGGYLCRMRGEQWYSQEDRSAPPFLCTYMGRSGKRESPFRFILNHSQAIAANTYLLLYPTPLLKKAMGESKEHKRAVWRALQAITPEALSGEGRLYGGGLHKIEPRELARVNAELVLSKLPFSLGGDLQRQPVLF